MMYSVFLLQVGLACAVIQVAAGTSVSSVTKAGESTGEIPPQENTPRLGMSNPDQERKKRQTCSTSAYRTADGRCNNLNNADWGASNQPFLRWLEPVYEAKTSTGSDLPSPRLVSTRVHFHLDFPSRRSTAMTMEWGQFLAHDIVLTPVMDHDKDCCDGSNAEDYLNGGPCFPITIPDRDRHFTSDCMEFTRSNPVANASPRNQYNTITAFIDASNVYGSSDAETTELRSFTDGRLLVEENNGQPEPNDLLPNLGDTECELTSTDTSDYCFSAGDERVNVFPGLSAMHTVFMREHNRIAAKLKTLNSTWDDETLFQKARKIVGAEMQVITYREWLPRIIGKDAMSKYGLKSRSYSYDENLDPTLHNVFATAALRFGHTMIPEKVKIGTTEKDLIDLFFRPKYVRDSVDDVVSGLLKTLTQRVDAWYVDGMTDHLFETPAKPGLDIVSLNIQRGRDHGLPPLNEWRAECGLNRIESFNGGDFQRRVGRDLPRVYSHPDDMDLYTGAISENSVPGGMVGPTYACLLGQQFQSLKNGDRYFYETGDSTTGFSRRQQREISRISLARIICDNTGISSIQRDVMNAIDNRHPEVACTSLNAMDLDEWK